MDLNTITEVVRPRDRGLAALAGRRRVAGRRDVAVLRAAAASDPADRSRRLGWPALRSATTGLRSAATCTIAQLDRLSLPARLDRRAADRPVLPGLRRLVQDLERGDRRRQPLHGAAGRADDLADRARWTASASIWTRTAASAACRSPISSPAAAQRARARRAAALDRPAGRGADAPRRVPAGLADAARPLGGAADRHQRAADARLC